MRSVLTSLSQASGVFKTAVLAPVALAIALAWAPAAAQFGGGFDAPDPDKLVQIEVPAATLAAGGSATVTVSLTIAETWHINANPPSPEYMIPTEVLIEGAHGVTAGTAAYPPPHLLNVEFDDAALFVYDGTAEVSLPLTASSQAVNGTHTLVGELRFQACNDQVCLAPVKVPFTVAVTVSGGTAETAGGKTGNGATAGGATAGGETGDRATGDEEDLADRGTGFATAPPSNGGDAPIPAALDNPIAQKLSGGGWTGFLSLFLIGLALNLTPCVYPMLGVTVSIFGARRAAPPLQVFGLALIYVLGIAVMYSTLGLIAAFTGGLFGGLLQSPIVLVGIGLLLIVLSLSMFGLYEFQLPPQLLAKLGGNAGTSVVGIFGSGLLVGIFAAPCIGPPVVALLTLVGAKGDPLFGFTSFFVLSMGLGAPYLILGTFSNLLQALPKSGDWMVWVKKVFGLILFSVGLFYALLVIAPEWGVWIAPVALVAGGGYLGFMERSAKNRPGFQWLKRFAGAAAMVSGVWFIMTMPSESIAFEDYTTAAVEESFANGTPVMIDFTADWCLPCHELEHQTFSDRRVLAAAKSFRTLKVDLTSYDSPEAEKWRKDFNITGVPTIVFLSPDGLEIDAARVEGFLPPDQFIAHMEYAAKTSGVQTAGF